MLQNDAQDEETAAGNFPGATVTVMTVHGPLSVASKSQIITEGKKKQAN